jgi:hypothetical protein
MALQLSPAELDLVRQWFNSLEDTNPKFLDAADRALMAKIRPAIQSDNLAKAQADGPKREWPHDAPLDWNADAAAFLAQVKACPHLWLSLGRAKYIELRIDTRDCGFNLYDRDRIHLSPDAVIAAIKDTNEKFGEAPTYRRPR